MPTEDRIAILRRDIDDLRGEVKELRRVDTRLTTVEATLAERARHKEERNSNWVLYVLMAGVIVSIVLGVAGFFFR